MRALDRLSSTSRILCNRNRCRTLSKPVGLDFASNDYLGLARSSLMQQAARDALDKGVPLGSGGSRLLRGNHAEHEALEQEAADFFGAEAALFMGGGFQANQAIFSTLPAAEDLVLFDALDS
ncbi:aminotransferase class I/II-fold pyridoxal phosphate-dependent enzyme [Ruegeria arenilitoris]|uniref:aminotransferase class I/II-fold pyridoxal phosphate-dependent enzyme n=1 Tax=Ruegeria arenilitoris TaxID=1173585 RepID=UPI003464BA1F